MQIMSYGLTQKQRRTMKNDHSPFAGMMRVMNHFFPHLADMFNQMEDPRHPAYIRDFEDSSVGNGGKGSKYPVALFIPSSRSSLAR